MCFFLLYLGLVTHKMTAEVNNSDYELVLSVFIASRISHHKCNCMHGLLEPKIIFGNFGFVVGMHWSAICGL